MIPIGTKLEQITQEQLKIRLSYDPEEGIFKWKVAYYKCDTGKPAGSYQYEENGKPSVVIRLHGKKYKAHRLVYLWMTNKLPDYPIYHHDNNSLNNKWNNLSDIKPKKPRIIPELTQEYLQSRLDYNSDSGIFIWKMSLSNRMGKTAGTVFNGHQSSTLKYLKICLNGRYCRAHRLAWMYVYGEWPKGEIDHINGDGLDNRIVNLRDVPHKVNARNSKLRITNKSGTLGVSYCNTYKKWQALALRLHLGYFDTKEEAIEARKKADPELGFHPNHGRKQGE